MRQKLIREWKKVFENDLSHLANEFLDAIDEPSIVIIEGEVGAGKTTFVKNCLEDDEEGASPTYSILYETEDYLHADFYRLESEEEIIHLELPMYLEGKKAFMVEWGKKYINRLEKEVPDNFNFFLLNIDILDEVKRNYQLYELEDF